MFLFLPNDVRYHGFMGGLYRVKKDGKWGFIDKTGKVVIPLVYDDVGYFTEGLCWVRKRDHDTEEYKYGFIDKKGVSLFPPPSF